MRLSFLTFKNIHIINIGNVAFKLFKQVSDLHKAYAYKTIEGMVAEFA